jgi:cyclopropane fatty-acyl-phospholipid synthase-like methyltransferase
VDDPKRIVAAGYDAIAETYRDWAEADAWPRLEWLALVEAELAPGSSVLELGCGAGVPVTRRLAERHRVTAVDLSARQIELARANAPEASFVHGDALAVELPESSFDAVVSLYMTGHVPRDEQLELVRRVACWLRPGGLLLMTLTQGASDGVVEADWLGAPMFFAGEEAETSLARVRASGFDVLRAELVPQVEFGREVRFLWLLARRARARKRL